MASASVNNRAFTLKVHPEGFTLIELLVAMAIIAVIAGAAWGNFFNSLAKGRDARRKDNLMAVAKSLELYYNDTKRYPPELPAPGTALVNSDDPSVIYMQKVPSDPGYPDAQYCYMTDGNGSFYKLYANLENRDDKSLLASPVNCSSEDYNYGIASSNVEP